MVLLFPPFNPTEPPPSTRSSLKNEKLHPFFRSSMIESLNPSKTFFYETLGVVQDYLLIPRSNPHLAGNFDPYAILLLTEPKHNSRTVHACQYPPPGFIKNYPSPPESEIKAKAKKDMEELSAADPQSPAPTSPEKLPRQYNYTPSSISIPFTLSMASSDILGGHLFKVKNDVYKSFVDKGVSDLHCLTLNGGQAYADPDLKLSKVWYHYELSPLTLVNIFIASTSPYPCDLQSKFKRPVL